ncbi:MAG: glycerol-3-phosphate 1-O-acyltransferase PlsY, partial [Bdellovibrionales bacterium]|nr:glycerol-3-phosphate 1-O-acyltransferase PlsY [Bdellovibrionales bacterium]
LFGLVLLALLLGGIPSGFLIGRAQGVDIREHGSGNIGATNALRTLGRRAAVATLLLDIGKGFGGAALGSIAGWGSDGVSVPAAQALCGTAAVVGHCWSPFLSWRGGKGVASGLGVFLFLAPVTACWGLGAFALTLAVMRVAAIASLIGAATIAGLGILLHPREPEITAAAMLIACIIGVRHRSNIRRLLRKTTANARPARRRTND